MTDPLRSTDLDHDSAGVARAYDRWAASYDADRNLTRDLDAEVLRRTDLPLVGADVLEVGCGTGKNTVWLAEHAQSLIALDLSAGMLARARERVPAAHVRFVQTDVSTAWPVPDATIDVVVGNLVLEHIVNLSPIYSEAARVLRPGGRLWWCELHPERQRRGGQAHFTDAGTGDTIHVAAVQHSVAEYVNGGIAAGLTLVALGEWLEAGAAPESPPRLLSVSFQKAVRTP